MIEFGVLCVFLLIKINLVSSSFFRTALLEHPTSECSQNLGIPFLKLGKKFLFFGKPSPVNFHAAGDFCREKGGFLADIENLLEFEALANHFQKNNLHDIYWIGIHSLVEGRTFTSDYSGDAALFTKWASGEPGRDGKCVAISYKDGSLGMRIDNCYNTCHLAICQVTKVPKNCNKIIKYVEHMETYIKLGEKYYYIERNTETTWYESQNLCRRANGHLADIESPEEFEILSDHLKQIGLTYGSIWLGGNDLAYEGTFQSIATGKPLSYFRWAQHEPNNANNGTDNCLNLWFYDGSFYMNDWSCYGTAYYICQPS